MSELSVPQSQADDAVVETVSGTVLGAEQPDDDLRSVIALTVSRTPGVSRVIPAPWWKRGLRSNPTPDSWPEDVPAGALSGVRLEDEGGPVTVEVEIAVDLSRTVRGTAEEVRRRTRQAIEQAGRQVGRVGVVVARAEAGAD